MNEVKQIMTNRGKSFLKKLLDSRNVIAEHAADFVTNGSKILTLGRSRVVYEALKLASAQNKHFHVYVTESTLDNNGINMVEDLKKINIDSTLILDAAIGYIMEKIDFVFCGNYHIIYLFQIDFFYYIIYKNIHYIHSFYYYLLHENINRG
jgi:translation initiation factor eIF-2B subunit alpha